MHRPGAQEFFRTLLETLDDLPPDLVRHLEEVVKKVDGDRAQAIRKVFEDVAGE